MTHFATTTNLTGCGCIKDNVVYTGAVVSHKPTEVDCNLCRKSKPFLKLNLN